MRTALRPVIIAVLAFALTFGGMWAGQQLFVSRQLNGPLLSTVRALPGVQSASLTSSGITVTLRPGADLGQVYPQVGTALRVAGKAPDAVALQNTDSRQLDNLARRINIVVAQGSATGQYVPMSQTIQSDAHHAKAGAVVAISDQHIFVTLMQGNARHYVVYALPPAHGSGNAPGGSGNA